MRFLVRGDFAQARVDRCREAGIGEVGGRQGGKTLAVEGCLKVFERQGIVEDIDWEVLVSRRSGAGALWERYYRRTMRGSVSC